MSENLRFFLIQALGLVPSIISFTALQSGSRHRILTLQMMCSVLWMLHYGLLGVRSGVIINLIGMLRAVVCAHNDERWAQGKHWLACFLIVYLLSPILGWDGPYCLLLSAAMMLTTVALWSHNMRLTRLLFLCNSPLVLLYNLFARSYSSVAMEICALISFGIAVWRFDIHPVKKKQLIYTDIQ